MPENIPLWEACLDFPIIATTMLGIAARRKAVWNMQKAYAQSPKSRHRSYADRMEHCGVWRGDRFYYCRVKLCPICQWRHQMQWYAKLIYGVLPAVRKHAPRAQYLLLTLIGQECAVSKLRSTLQTMAEGWRRLTQLRIWPAFGWVRKLMVDYSKEFHARPRYSCLMIVHPYYLHDGPLAPHEWAELWQDSLRYGYRPVVEVQQTNTVKIQQRGWEITTPSIAVPDNNSTQACRYLWGLTNAVWKEKTLTSGGCMKQFLKAVDKQYWQRLRPWPENKPFHFTAPSLPPPYPLP